MQFSFMLTNGQEHTYFRVINGPEVQENESSGLDNLQKSTLKKVLKKVSVRRIKKKSRKEKTSKTSG